MNLHHSDRLKLSGSSLLITAALMGVLTAGCSGSDIPMSKDDPATNRSSVRVVAQDFADAYNSSGMREAVDRTFCSDDVGRYSERTSLSPDGSAGGDVEPPQV